MAVVRGMLAMEHGLPHCWVYGAELFGNPTEELETVAEYFAQNAANLAGQVARDEMGHFAEKRLDCMEQGVSVYDNLTKEFPILSMESKR